MYSGDEYYEDGMTSGSDLEDLHGLDWNEVNGSAGEPDEEPMSEASPRTAGASPKSQRMTCPDLMTARVARCCCSAPPRITRKTANRFTGFCRCGHLAFFSYRLDILGSGTERAGSARHRANFPHDFFIVQELN